MGLKVFGGLTIQDRKQVRTIVAANSKKRAAQLLGVSMHELNGWWCETGNDTEIRTATSAPGVVFVASTSMSKDFKPLPPNRRAEE